jgi:Outer membrane protein beta-barrel domain
MKNLILFCFLTLPFLAFSQSRSSLDYMISPDITYRILSYDGSEKQGIDIKRRNDSAEVSKIGAHVGVGYNVKLSSKIWLKMGLQVSSMGYKRSTKTQWGSQNNNGTFDPNLPGEPKFSNTIDWYYGVYYFNLPVIARYEFNENKLSPYFELGLVPSYAVERYTNTIYGSQESKMLDESTNKFAVMLHWGVGVNFKLNEKWKIYFQPTIRYQLNSNTAPIKEHLYSIGIEFGARMSL